MSIKNVPKKKRGRKSKTDIVAKNVVIDDSHYMDNLVIHLKKELNTIDISKDNTPIVGYDPISYTNIESKGTIRKCWNCCHKIQNIVGIPLRYENDVFHCYGDFCSFECCGRYIIDNYHNNDLFNKFTLLNILYNQTYKTINKTMQIAPNRLLLQLFGGPLTIEEYKKENINSYDINVLPIIPIQNTFVKYDGKIKNDSISELKLYRKSGSNLKKNIYNSMNIQTKKT